MWQEGQKVHVTVVEGNGNDMSATVYGIPKGYVIKLEEAGCAFCTVIEIMY